MKAIMVERKFPDCIGWDETEGLTAPLSDLQASPFCLEQNDAGVPVDPLEVLRGRIVLYALVVLHIEEDLRLYPDTADRLDLRKHRDNLWQRAEGLQEALALMEPSEIAQPNWLEDMLERFHPDQVWLTRTLQRIQSYSNSLP